MWTCPACKYELNEDAEFICSTCGFESGVSVYRISGSKIVHERVIIKYDPAVIQEYARIMYRDAKWLEVGYTIFGIVAGIIVGQIVGANNGNNVTYSFLGAIVGGVIGYSIGSSRAFWLRLQAQLALCQVEIEKGVRK